MSSAALRSSAGSGSAPSSNTAPGSTGTPAAAMSSFAAVFDPIASMASGGGPTKVRPAAAQARAKPAFSERNPYPGCTASAPVVAAAAISAPPRR